MELKLIRSWKFPVTGLQFLVIVVLILGIFFRFVNLNQKVYWGDEAYSSSRISGYTTEEIVQTLYTGREISVEELQKYQRPNSDKSWTDTLNVIATEAPHHPPLYFLMARFWEQAFGFSMAVKRTFPALISLLTFPCLYWLCLELFSSSLTAWIAIALVAVSPIHLLYAQEVREYSLWTVTVLLSSASLLYAMRVKTKSSWIIYALTLVLAFYSYLFSGLVAVGQGIYVLFIERLRWSKTLKSYLLAATVSLLFFLPWLIIFFANESEVSSGWAWVVKDLSPLNFYQRWVTNLVRGFFDVQWGNHDPFDVPFGYDQPTAYLIVPIVFLVAYAIYFLFRNTPKQIWLFVLLLMVSTSLPLVLPDVISGGRRSTIPRYQLPSYLGIQLAVSYLLSTKLSSISASLWHQKLWRLITVALISCGVISCGFIAQSTTWWTKYTDYYNADVARVINQSTSPLLCSDSSPNRILAISHLLDPNVRIKLVKIPKEGAEFPLEKLPDISGNYSDVFFLETVPPASFLRLEFEKYKNYKFELLYEQKISFKQRQTLLWRLVHLGSDG